MTYISTRVSAAEGFCPKTLGEDTSWQYITVFLDDKDKGHL